MERLFFGREFLGVALIVACVLSAPDFAVADSEETGNLTAAEGIVAWEPTCRRSPTQSLRR